MEATPTRTLANLTAAGGVRNLNSGTVNVTNCTLSGNSAVGNGSNTAAFGGGIFNNSTGTVNITNSTLTGNSAIGGGLAGRGGGICNNGTGIVNVVNSTLGSNTADVSGGAIDNLSTGTVNVTNSMVTSNSVGGLCCGGGGAGIDNFAGAVNINYSTVSENSFIENSNTSGFIYYGGGILTSCFNVCGTLTVTGSTISNNSAVIGGGIFGGEGTVNIINSTISGNFADASQYDPTMQGANGGGGISVRFGNLNVTNSTLSGNGVFGTSAAIGGGGICMITDTSFPGTINVSNSTLTDNTVFGEGTTGGGIINFGNGPVDVKSSIIALNAADSSPDISGAFASAGFNLIGKTDGSTGFTAATDQTGTIASPLDPKLDDNGLQNNGGPTQTIALLTGSPAIDKGTSNSLTGTLIVDQRGVGYARTADDPSVPNATGGDGTDIGAFEFGAQIIAVSQKTHGPNSDPTKRFGVALPLTGANIGIECRRNTGTDSSGPNAGHDHEVVVTFPRAVTVGGVSVTTGNSTDTPTATSSVSSNIVTVDLHNIPNARRLTIALSNVSDGTNTNDVDIPMGVLFGDVNGSGRVDATDVSLVRQQTLQTIGSSNFQEDIDLSDRIDATDVAIARQQTLTSLP